MNHVLSLLLIVGIRTYAEGFAFTRLLSNHRNQNSHHAIINRRPLPTTIISPNAADSSHTLMMTAQERFFVTSEEHTSAAAHNSNTIFPVISRIAGTNWTGACRYVGSDLVHKSSLKLVGGVRYDINATTDRVTLSSFLTFPNGKTREVMMEGTYLYTGPTNTGDTLKLTSVEEGGPIYMLLTELTPDTILINEVDESSGKIILTASLSIIEDKGKMELVQVSHEIGNGGEEVSIEGHQVWRLSKAPIEFDDFDVRGTTGR